MELSTMKLFLTSSIGGSYVENGSRYPCGLDNSNHFLDLLKGHWTIDSKCLILSSDPEDIELNDSFKVMFEEAFKISDFSLSEIEVCDVRNMSSLEEMLYDYDVIIIAGGHVPIQNKFYNSINLKNLLKIYSGIIISISAGTMNCADVVYAQPELEGEATNPKYQKYINGLDLTKINILPHYQELKDLTLDGLRVIEDISLPDSFIRPFYALVDGAFIYVENHESIIYGEAYLLQDGTITKVCDTDKHFQIIN